MPRHKRRTRLPNRYGSICYLGKGRRRPYAAYPPVTQYTDDGRIIRPKALGYTETYNEAMELLVLYHKGFVLPDVNLVPKTGPTFAEVYELFFNDKYSNNAKQLSRQSIASTQAAYKHASALYDRDFASITYPDLQAVLDNCSRKHATLENIRTLFRGIYRYAEKYELIDKDPSKHLEIRIPDDDEHGIPFTDEELGLLWAHKSDSIAQMLLVICYSGFRVTAYQTLDIHTQPEWYFQGGLKTAAGKNRIVPVHSAIQPLVSDLLSKYGYLIPNPSTFRKWIRKYLPTIGIVTDHTPHDCRHTFSRLCEKYNVPENDRKRLLGHAFSDVTNQVYGHRTLEELRASIEKIQAPV